MDVPTATCVSDGSGDPARELELAAAFDLLDGLMDWQRADEIMPLGPATVYTASITLWLLVYQGMHPRASLSEAVLHLISHQPKHLPDNKRLRDATLSEGTGAYSQARQRLTREVTEWFAGEVSRLLIDAAPAMFGDQRVYFFDGSTIPLAPEPALRKAFPPASNQHGTAVFPVALIVMAHELSSGCGLIPQVGAMYGPNAVSETALVPALMAQMPPRSIVLADANFGIFSVAYAAHCQGHNFLLRMTAARFRFLQKGVPRMIDEGQTATGLSWKTYQHIWSSSPHDRRKHPDLPVNASLSVKLHEIELPDGKTLSIVTDLTASCMEVAEIYRRRGDIETDIGNFKIVLDGEHIRSRSVPMFHKELLTSFVAYNLVCQFRRQAALLAQVQPRRLSFTRVWTTFCEFLINTPLTDPKIAREQFDRALHHASRMKLPNRPNRNYPREAYRQTHKSIGFLKRKPRDADD
jgi:hypothetical protein